ncbi:MarR family winged helix-turn-helix transcriptional regulator [Nissabacter sp. SGAir0207]|uniref:MarR family winged helix-turn-helix transcriptional regulator n=1 Tax=Nissabacter sp. SGAir0207 TaxID=2126321 RepID=UPI0026D4E8AB
MPESLIIPPEQNFIRALHFTSRALRQAIDRRLKAQGLNQASWVAVSTIAMSEPPLCQGELAARLGLEGASVVSMIDKLARQGLVRRQVTPEDRRKRLVVATEAGFALYEQAKGEADALHKSLMSKLDPAELAAAVRVLDALREASEQSE